MRLQRTLGRAQMLIACLLGTLRRFYVVKLEICFRGSLSRDGRDGNLLTGFGRGLLRFETEPWIPGSILEQARFHNTVSHCNFRAPNMCITSQVFLDFSNISFKLHLISLVELL